MSNTTITKRFYVDETLTDPSTSITIAVTRTDTGATVVSTTAMTQASTGVYYHTFANPASNLTYEWAVTIVHDSETYITTGTQSAGTGLAVSLGDVKDHLHIDTTDSDDTLTAYIQAATSFVEESTRRRFLDTTETRTQSKFINEQRMRYSPLSSITSITYYDTDDAQQTLSTDVYGVVTGDAGHIYLKNNQSWPSLYNRPDAVTITFVAGYGTASEVPPWAAQAIKMLVGHWYENREAVTVPTRMSNILELPLAVPSIIQLHKVWEVVD